MSGICGKQIPDKSMRSTGSQQPASAGAACAKCQGSGKTAKADGTKQMCYFCRGTGVSGGNYQTK